MFQQKYFVEPGETYCKWSVVGGQYSHPAHGPMVVCMCECGRHASLRVRQLVTGKTKSCGCDQITSSEEAMRELWDIYWKMSMLNGWREYKFFEKWAIKNGFVKGAKLLKHNPSQPHGYKNSYWTPSRKWKNRDPKLDAEVRMSWWEKRATIS